MSRTTSRESLAKPQALYTTGQVAQLLGCSPRTVCKWFDCGKLDGYLLPGGKDRRITRASLARLLHEHGMPPLACLDDTLRVLLVGLPPVEVGRLVDLLPGILLVGASNGFEAGVLTQAGEPRVAVLDASLGRLETRGMVVGLQRVEVPRLLVLTCEDDAGRWECETLQRPFDLALLAQWIARPVPGNNGRSIHDRS